MPSRRTATIAFAAAFAVGLCLLLAGGLTTRSRLVSTLGVLAVYPVAPLGPGQEVCESPVGLADPVERVRFNIGTFGKPGTPLEVTVLGASSGRTLGHGFQPGGWVDNGAPTELRVGHIAGGQDVSVCVRNRGTINANVYGDFNANGILGVRPNALTSSAAVNGVPIPGDISVAFIREHDTSLLSRLPAAFRHAARFRPAGVGSWTWWLLAALVLVVAPMLLVRALRSAVDEDADDAPLPSSPRR